MNTHKSRRSKNILLGPVFGYLSRLRFPWLFVLTAGLFGVDLLVPDLIPLADEILLGLATLTLGAWRQKKHTKLEDTTANEPA